MFLDKINKVILNKYLPSDPYCTKQDAKSKVVQSAMLEMQLTESESETSIC